jgi:hypothetical protein
MNQEEQIAKCLAFILQRTALSKAKYPFPTAEEPEPEEEPEYSAKALAVHEAIKEAEFGCQEPAVRKLVEVLLEQKLPEEKSDGPPSFVPGPDLEILPFSALIVDEDTGYTSRVDLFLNWTGNRYNYIDCDLGPEDEHITDVSSMGTFRYATEEEIKEAFAHPDVNLIRKILLRISAEEALREMFKEE